MKSSWLIASLVAGFVFDCVSADDWRGFSLWNESELTTASSFRVIYQGEVYDPGKPVEMNAVVDRSSPISLLSSLFWALNKQDVNLYRQLFAPGEMRSTFVPNASNQVSHLLLQRRLDYGDFHILQVELTVPAKRYPYLFCVRKVGDEYFASHLIKKDKAFSFLNYYCAFAPLIGSPHIQDWKDARMNSDKQIAFTNFALGKADAHPSMTFVFEGRAFGVNMQITNWPTRKSQDVTTPVGTLKAVLAALREGDEKWYGELLHPDERESRIQYGFKDQQNRTWRELLHERFTTAAKKPLPASIQLVSEVEYGDSVVMMFAGTGVDQEFGSSWLCFRRSGNEWLLSDKLNSSSNLLLNYLGLAADFHTRLFPSFSSGTADQEGARNK